MHSLLLKLILIASLAQFGMSIIEFENCHSVGCIVDVQRKIRSVVAVDWKPISVFPNEAKRFTSAAKEKRTRLKHN